jgi:uncharacterized protein YjbI with pentapeptide repeats
MTHIFISYNQADYDFAELLKEKLEKADLTTWFDKARLRIGNDWRQEIDRAISQAAALVVVMTPEAKASEYVTYEWGFALGAGVKVIPVMLRRTQLHPRLEALQYLDFTHQPSRPWGSLIDTLREATEPLLKRNKQYQIASYWDRHTSLQDFDLTERDLKEVDLRRADLRGADLTGADLTEANLSKADLTRANLSRATLTQIDLSEADLRWADLSQTTLCEADLRNATLVNARLANSNLSEADLANADLSKADLNKANLRLATMTDVNLCYAKMKGATLSKADLRGADLRWAKLDEANLYGIVYNDATKLPRRIDLKQIEAVFSED